MLFESIWLEPILVVDLRRGVLLGLAQHAIADDEKLDLVAHEAAEDVFGRAYDRLDAHAPLKKLASSRI